jgi:hypothetical protein
MQVEEAVAPGFDSETLVRATKTVRAFDSTGAKIKIRALTVGIPDSSRVDDGHQYIHFENGGGTPCVRFPVEALAPA